VYIFLDESGKPEIFSAKGVNLVKAGSATKYLVLAAVRTPNQLLLQSQILEFKAGLLKDPLLTSKFSPAYALDSFHATNDYPEVRERFYQFINALDVEIHVIVCEKLLCSKNLQADPSLLYGTMAGLILHGICHQSESTEIIFSRQDSKYKLQEKLESEVEKIRQSLWNAHLKKETYALRYQHNPHYSHGGLQVADYAAYAVFKLFEKRDDLLYLLIQNKIRHIHHYNQKKHFTRSRPLELSS
jgi:hypothetical protein